MYDAKEKQLINHYHDKIISKTFDERDIYSFLILLRRHAKVKSPVYELANFVAHRERDRRYFFDYINNNKYKLDRLGKINTTIESKLIFSSNEIKNSFNTIMGQINLSEFSEENINDITVCLIVLLQDVMLVDKKNKCIGKLAIGINKNNVTLIGVAKVDYNGRIVNCAFPILEVPNNYTKNFNQNDMAILKVVTEVIRINSKLELRFLTECIINQD